MLNDNSSGREVPSGRSPREPLSCKTSSARVIFPLCGLTKANDNSAPQSTAIEMSGTDFLLLINGHVSLYKKRRKMTQPSA